MKVHSQNTSDDEPSILLMQGEKMSTMNDDGVALDLSAVLILFLMPNLMLVILTILGAYLIHLSDKHPRLNRALGRVANGFAKGALDRVVRNMLREVEAKRRHHGAEMTVRRMNTHNARKSSRASRSSSSSDLSEKKADVNYLLLIPFQVDLLLTVFVYKILTRDVYFETCQSYLTTYHSRPNQVVCWLKNTNKNVSNLSSNVSLHRYCSNQSITYINFEHNDVMCTQYVFKSINIIDTVTNIFAWHQAIVFIVTRSILFCYWYQRRLRRTKCWASLFECRRQTIVSAVVAPTILAYILVFIVIVPLRFIYVDRQRVDLTRHLMYACSKFITATIVHVNLYALCQWRSVFEAKDLTTQLDEEQNVGSDLSPPMSPCDVKTQVSPLTSAGTNGSLFTLPREECIQ